jgi:tetratricopeptide (TPR) repeat protein
MLRLGTVRAVALCVVVFAGTFLVAQSSPDQLQVGPPPLRRAEPPSAGASAEDLEKQGDQLRADKAYLDALDYYRASVRKKADSALLYNKIGITELMIHRLKDARKDFEKAIKLDRRYADAYNNLGVVYYADKNPGKAIRQYRKAIELSSEVAPYHNNLGAAYFQKKEFEKAVESYSEALRLDPNIFERTSRAGVLAQLPSPDDRAHYDYVLAKLFAKMGIADRSLEYLRKAMEEGYKQIGNVYKDAEFTELRKDPRFTELMASKPTAISD